MVVGPEIRVTANHAAEVSVPIVRILYRLPRESPRSDAAVVRRELWPLPAPCIRPVTRFQPRLSVSTRWSPLVTSSVPSASVILYAGLIDDQ